METQSNIPGPNDVLFSGGKITKHAGTLAFRQMIKDYSAVYDSGTDATKRQIAENLLERVHESGGRFLKQSKNSTSWEDVPPKELRKKIMQSFRNRRKLNTSSSVTTAPGTLIQGGPQQNDVLFGRTKQTRGTKMLQILIENHFEQYESLDRGVKMKLVEQIMYNLTSQGGRFLQPAKEPGNWLQVSHDEARERISKTFRNYRRSA